MENSPDLRAPSSDEGLELLFSSEERSNAELQKPQIFIIGVRPRITKHSIMNDQNLHTDTTRSQTTYNTIHSN
jgi:hypothetical protein